MKDVMFACAKSAQTHRTSLSASSARNISTANGIVSSPLVRPITEIAGDVDGQLYPCEATFLWLLFVSPKAKGTIIMSRRCEICGKGEARGNHILRRGQAKKKGGIGQHVTAVTPRIFRPNLQVAHAIVNGVRRRIKVCANCIK